MNRVSRLVALFVGMFCGYLLSSLLLEISEHNLVIYPEFKNYNIFTALASGNFWYWILWYVHTHPSEIMIFFTIVGGLVAVCLVK